MRSVVYLILCLVFCGFGVATVVAVGTEFTYQGRLHVDGNPAEGGYDFSFSLFDALTERTPIGTAVSLRNVPVTGGYFTVPLDFGAAAFDGNPRWLEISVAPYVTKIPLRKTVLSPRQPITVVPYAIRAQNLSGTIDVSQITGLLGQGYSILFPDILYNQVNLWVWWPQDNWSWSGSGVILVGPGVDIDRIKGFDSQGHPLDNPGFALEHPIVFEAAEPQATTLKSYINTHPNSSPVLCAMDVPQFSGQSFFHIPVFELTTQGYESGLDGRTRFRFAMTKAPDRFLTISILRPDDFHDFDFGSAGSYNPAADNPVLIDGVGGPFFPEVALDETQRTLTLTYGSDEGAGIFYWVKRVVEGNNDQRIADVIQLDATGNMIGWISYQGCFPIKYEIFDGFGLNTKLRARVVLSYNIRLIP